MTSGEIIQLVGLSSTIFASLTGFIVALVKANKGKKMGCLKDELKSYIISAEEYTTHTGAQKKSLVLSWAEDYCKKQGIKFDAEQVGNAIDELIELTKMVNKREKDKLATAAI